MSTFKTATGYCHILHEYILLSANENPETVNEEPPKKTGHWGNILRSIVISICFVAGIYGMLINDFYRGGIMFVIAGLFVAYHIKQLSFADTTLIRKDRITKIEYKEPIYNVQKPHFLISFLNDNNRVQKRIIPLSNDTFQKDTPDLKEALRIMNVEFE